jgi:hypothetical protein
VNGDHQRCRTAAEWVFRHAGGCLIEVPPLELPTPRPSHTALHSWVSTLWRDVAGHGGWARLDWVRADRGWELPRHLAVGDVLEFGLAAVDLVNTYPPGWDRRWYGWLRYCTDLAVVVVGRYPNPEATAAAAAETIDEIRLGQLTLTAVDPAADQPTQRDVHNHD